MTVCSGAGPVCQQNEPFDELAARGVQVCATSIPRNASGEREEVEKEKDSNDEHSPDLACARGGGGTRAVDGPEAVDLVREAVGRVGANGADPEASRLEVGWVHHLARAVSTATGTRVRAAGPIAADAQVNDERVLTEVLVRVAGSGGPSAGRVAPGRRIGPALVDVGRHSPTCPLHDESS